MYVLLIILSINIGGKAISSTQIQFINEKLCLEAKEEIYDDIKDDYSETYIVCLRSK